MSDKMKYLCQRACYWFVFVLCLVAAWMGLIEAVDPRTKIYESIFCRLISLLFISFASWVLYIIKSTK